jgi:hypothetical protein
MKKLGTVGTKWIKILHIISVGLWFGGVMALLALSVGLPLSDFEEVNTAYRSMRIIDTLLVRNGAQGIIITSLLYSIFTNWGFFKHKWVVVKWVAFIAQMIFGIVFLNGWTEANVILLEAEKSMALINPVFIQNHSLRQTGIIIQIVVIVILICISVLKPWKNKSTKALGKYL